MQLQLIEILGKCRDCPIWVRSPLLLIILDWTLCEREILLRSIAFLKILLFPVLIFFFLQVYVLVHKTRPTNNQKMFSCKITADGLRSRLSSSTTYSWIYVIPLHSIRTRGTCLATYESYWKVTLRTRPAQQLSVTRCLNWCLLFPGSPSFLTQSI